MEDVKLGFVMNYRSRPFGKGDGGMGPNDFDASIYISASTVASHVCTSGSLLSFDLILHLFLHLEKERRRRIKPGKMTITSSMNIIQHG